MPEAADVGKDQARTRRDLELRGIKSLRLALARFVKRLDAHGARCRRAGLHRQPCDHHAEKERERGERLHNDRSYSATARISAALSRLPNDGMPPFPSLMTLIWSSMLGKRATTRPPLSCGPRPPPPSLPWQLAHR